MVNYEALGFKPDHFDAMRDAGFAAVAAYERGATA